jgi:hypothetical protein
MSDYNPASDPRSANSLIHAYLASKGLQPTGENVRRALEANAAHPGMISSPEGGQLFNQSPGAAGAAVRGPGGSGIPTPPVPSSFDEPGSVLPGAPSGPSRDSASGSETRVGGTGGSTSAPPVAPPAVQPGASRPTPGAPASPAPPVGGTANGPSLGQQILSGLTNAFSSSQDAQPTMPSGGGSSAGLTNDELNNALIASALGTAGAGGAYMAHLWNTRKLEPPMDANKQVQMDLRGGSGTAPPRQGDLPLQGGGSRVNQPELPLQGGGSRPQGDLFNPRPPPGALPPAQPATVPPPPAPSQAVRPPNAFVDPALTNRLNAGPLPTLPAQPVPPQPVITPDQFRAQNPGTVNVPPAEVAPTAPRARAPRVRVGRIRAPL